MFNHSLDTFSHKQCDPSRHSFEITLHLLRPFHKTNAGNNNAYLCHTHSLEDYNTCMQYLNLYQVVVWKLLIKNRRRKAIRNIYKHKRRHI